MSSSLPALKVTSVTSMSNSQARPFAATNTMPFAPRHDFVKSLPEDEDQDCENVTVTTTRNVTLKDEAQQQQQQQQDRLLQNLQATIAAQSQELVTQATRAKAAEAKVKELQAQNAEMARLAKQLSTQASQFSTGVANLFRKDGSSLAKHVKHPVLQQCVAVKRQWQAEKATLQARLTAETARADAAEAELQAVFESLSTKYSAHMAQALRTTFATTTTSEDGACS